MITLIIPQLKSQLLKLYLHINTINYIDYTLSSCLILIMQLSMSLTRISEFLIAVATDSLNIITQSFLFVKHFLKLFSIFFEVFFDENRE